MSARSLRYYVIYTEIEQFMAVLLIWQQKYIYLMVISYFHVVAGKSYKVYCFIHEILGQIGINWIFEEKSLSLEYLSIYIQIRTDHKNDDKPTN